MNVRRVLLIEGGVNVAAFLGKLAAGLLTGSVALIADALHSLVDVVNNGLALVASRLAATPPDGDHPYGHKKFEWLAIFVLATLLGVMALEVVIRALDRGERSVQLTSLGVALMGGVLLVNVGLAWWQRRWARRLRSELLAADARHTLGDVATTAVVVVGTYVAGRGYPWLDTVLALAVAGFVCYLAFGLFRRALPVLVDESALDAGAVADSLRRLAGVRSVGRVRSRRVGPDVFADVVVGVDASLSAQEAHRIADAVEHHFVRTWQVADVVVHVETEAVPPSGSGT